MNKRLKLLRDAVLKKVARQISPYFSQREKSIRAKYHRQAQKRIKEMEVVLNGYKADVATFEKASNLRLNIGWDHSWNVRNLVFTKTENDRPANQ